MCGFRAEWLTLLRPGRGCRWAMVVHFSEETGKMTQVNHYVDTEIDWALYTAHGV